MATGAAGLAASMVQVQDPAPAMFRGSPDHRGTTATTGVREFGQVRWRFVTNGPVRSSPIESEGTVFVGSTDGNLYAVDADSGEMRWSFRARAAVASSPALAGDLVIFGDRTNTYWALERTTGAVRWSLPTGPDQPLPWGPEGWDYHTASATIVGTRAYFGSGDGGIYAVDWRTGEVVWRVATPRRIRSTAAVVGDVLYIGGGDGLVRALSTSDGSEIWRFRTEGVDLDAESAGFDRTQIQASPAVVDGTVYIGSRDAFLYALDASTGEERWRRDDGSAWVVSSVAVSGDRLFNGRSSSGNFRGVDRHDGEELWVQNARGAVFTSPTVADGLVYVASGGGWMWAYDATTGAVAWQYRLTRAGGIYSSPLVSDGRIYVGADDGALYALEGPRAQAPRRAVFWDEDLRHRALFGRQDHDRLVADYFESLGYDLLDAPALESFMADRIADGRPSVVVFAMSFLPESLGAGGDGAPFRDYLDAGGKVVWMGHPPRMFVMDDAGEAIVSVDAARPASLLDVDFAEFNTDVYGVSVTSAGRAWGLRQGWVGNGSLGPEEPTQVLGVSEVGHAAAWVKRFGGPQGTGFVLLPPARDSQRLAQYRWVAELGVTWSGRKSGPGLER